MGHLDSKLVYFGGEQNPYIDFRASENIVSVDPDGSLGGTYSTTNAPVCYAQCIVYSHALLGKCCTCEGKAGTYVKLRPKTFVCK